MRSIECTFARGSVWHGKVPATYYSTRRKRAHLLLPPPFPIVNMVSQSLLPLVLGLPSFQHDHGRGHFPNSPNQTSPLRTISFCNATPGGSSLLTPADSSSSMNTSLPSLVPASSHENDMGKGSQGYASKVVVAKPSRPTNLVCPAPTTRTTTVCRVHGLEVVPRSPLSDGPSSSGLCSLPISLCDHFSSVFPFHH